MALVHGWGVNDTPKGWRDDEVNNAVYYLWYEMCRKCKPSAKLDTLSTYKDNGFSICDRWKSLSNFAEDIKNVIRYDEWVESLKTSKKLHFIISSHSSKPIYSLETTEFSRNAVKRTWANNPL